ncbi:MAG: hypothetical protein M4D80_28760 [Myxococcota bacterium]|nr:hypothetical protein [Deltaproteobacteria bacterium]MDQ3339172.1 hypothetical protein [Myxococcota bacterium]
MFKSRNEETERYARAVGRIVFGAVLLVGVAILVQRVISVRDPQAAKIIVATWIVAGFCGWASRQVTAPFAERANVHEIFTLSYAVPALGLALMLPISLHLVVAVPLGLAGELDDWVRLSLFITAATHVVFATMVTRRAIQLAQGRIAVSTRRIYTTTLVVSCIPFAVIFFIPPLLVGFTGLALVPLMDRMEGMIDRERSERAPLPMAILV